MFATHRPFSTLLGATVLWLLAAGGVVGCGSAPTVQNTLEQQILSTGDFRPELTAEIAESGIRGAVWVEGCTQLAAWTDATPGQSFCRRFPARLVSVRVTSGAQVFEARTDGEGGFVFDNASQLQALTNAGDAIVVRAAIQGRIAEATLGAGGDALRETAALAAYDALAQPVTRAELENFVGRWQGTSAALLALDQHGGLACGALRDEWNGIMRGGDARSAGTLEQTFDASWQDAFCGYCVAECNALAGVDDLSSELGALY